MSVNALSALADELTCNEQGKWTARLKGDDAATATTVTDWACSVDCEQLLCDFEYTQLES